MLKQRVITGIVLALIGIFLLFGTGPFFPFFLWVIFGVMGVEWVAMRQQRLGKSGEFIHVTPYQYDNFVRCCVVGAFIFLTALFFFLPGFSIKLGAIFWLFALVSLFFSQDSVRFLVLPWPYQIIGLVILTSAWIAAVRLHELSPWLLLYAIFVIAASDIAAYFVGRKWGKHFLAPEISPKKTWEGAFGGLIAGVVVSLIFMGFSRYFLHGFSISWLRWILSGVLLGVFGIVGDLFESRIKRLVNVKDSGKILPGHGGLWDRFDSHVAGFVVAAFVFLV